MNGWIAVIALVLTVWFERHLVLWSLSWLPRPSPTEGLEGGTRDLGFSVLSPTPSSLPDVWALIITICTIIVIARRDPKPSSPGEKMMHHLLFVGGCLWLFASPLGILSTIPSECSLIVPPLHASSVLAHLNNIRLSYHSVYLTVLMLAWKSYKADSGNLSDKCLWIIHAIWFLSVLSLVSSRIDFTADVVRGVLFGYIVFNVYAAHFEGPVKRKSLASNSRWNRQLFASIPSKRAERHHSFPDWSHSISSESSVESSGGKRARGERKARHTSQMMRDDDMKNTDSVCVLRQSYLDLMKNTLMNMFYRDESVFKVDTDWSIHNSPLFSASIRQAGMDMPSMAHCKTGTMRLDYVQSCVQCILCNKVEGDLINVGVWRGGVSVFMRSILHAHDDTNRRVLMCGRFHHDRVRFWWPIKICFRLLTTLFPRSLAIRIASCISYFLPVSCFPSMANKDVDDFTDSSALSNQMTRRSKYIMFALQHPDLMEKAFEGTRLNEVKNTFKLYGFMDRQVEFICGELMQTIPRLVQNTFAVIRLASGISASSCSIALRKLYPRLSSGGFIICDNYAGAMGCFNTVDKFLLANNIRVPLKRIDYQCVGWQKP